MAGLLFLWTAPVVMAGDCDEAVDTYTSAIGEVDSALTRYRTCVAGSQGKDDCWTEFRRLKRAQDDFESAVSNIGGPCARHWPT